MPVSQETDEDVALLCDQAIPSVESVVIDECYKVATSSDARGLCESPYIRMNQIEPVLAPILPVGEWKSMMLP